MNFSLPCAPETANETSAEACVKDYEDVLRRQGGKPGFELVIGNIVGVGVRESVVRDKVLFHAVRLVDGRLIHTGGPVAREKEDELVVR